MQKLTGTIIDITPIVMNGNTVYVFTLMKAARQYMEYDDEVY